MKYLVAMLLASATVVTVSTLPACCVDVDARIIIEDATGKYVYVQEKRNQPGFLRRQWDKVYKFPRRHPRYWKVGKFTGSCLLWACQVRAALK